MTETKEIERWEYDGQKYVRVDGDIYIELDEVLVMFQEIREKIFGEKVNE